MVSLPLFVLHRSSLRGAACAARATSRDHVGSCDRCQRGDRRSSYRPVANLRQLPDAAITSVRIDLEPLQLSVQRGAADAERLRCRRTSPPAPQQRPLQHCRAGPPQRWSLHGVAASRSLLQPSAAGSTRPRRDARAPLGPDRVAPITRSSASTASDPPPCRRPRAVSTMRAWANALRNKSASIRLAASPAASAIRLAERVGAVGAAGGDVEHAGKRSPRGRRSERPCSSDSVLRVKKCWSRSIVSGRCSTRQVPMPLVPSCSSLQSAPVHRPQDWNVASSAAVPRRSTGTPVAVGEQHATAARADRLIEPVHRALRSGEQRRDALARCGAARRRSAAAARCDRRDRDDAIGTNGATTPRARTAPPGLTQWRPRHGPRDAGALAHSSRFLRAAI